MATFIEMETRERDRRAAEAEARLAAEEASTARALAASARARDEQARVSEAWHEARRAEREAVARWMEAERAEAQAAEVDARLAARFPSADASARTHLKPLILQELAAEDAKPVEAMRARYKGFL